MIEVIAAGMFTTIQDSGRYGYRKWGVPLSGVMDQRSARLANHLVNNTNDEAIMEITMTAPILKFNVDTVIAITGAGFSPSVNGQKISMNKAVQIPKGSVIKFGKPSYGVRAYLSALGGFSVPKILDSYSFYPNITENFHIKKGNILSINTSEIPTTDLANSSVKISKAHFESPIITVDKGPEFNLLSKAVKEKLLHQSFEISNDSNRMGYRLSAAENIAAAEIITSSVQPGTVQLTPSGQIIILMRDCQTTGGYARILQLTDDAINVLAQKRAEESVRFVLRKLPF